MTAPASTARAAWCAVATSSSVVATISGRRAAQRRRTDCRSHKVGCGLEDAWVDLRNDGTACPRMSWTRKSCRADGTYHEGQRRRRCCTLKAREEAADLVLPAAARGQHLLQVEDGVDEGRGRGKGASHRAAQRGQHGAGQDAAGSQACSAQGPSRERAGSDGPWDTGVDAYTDPSPRGGATTLPPRGQRRRRLPQRGRGAALPTGAHRRRAQRASPMPRGPP